MVKLIMKGEKNAADMGKLQKTRVKNYPPIIKNLPLLYILVILYNINR